MRCPFLPSRFCRVKVKDLESFLKPIFAAWNENRRLNEGFGDWTARTGFPAVKQLVTAAAPPMSMAAK